MSMSDTNAPTDNGSPDPATIENPASAPGEGDHAESPDTSTDDAKGEANPDDKPASKTFTQDELDEIVKREKAKVARRFQREIERATAPTAAPPEPLTEPRRDQFKSDDEYVDAKVEWRLAEKARAESADRAKAAQRQILEKTETLYAEAEKIRGFDRTEFDDLPITPTISRTIIDSDEAPKLMAYLCKHPDVVERIAKLPRERQAAEIGKLEEKAAAEFQKPRPQTSKAPAPIEPVSGSRGGASADPASMSHEEYRAWRAKQGAPWAPRPARRSP